MSLDPRKVAAVLVTRGDVDMTPILETLPRQYEVVVFNNAKEPFDWGLFGRYMGILRTRRPVIFVQDDDCLVRNHGALLAAYEPGRITANFRNDPARLPVFHDSTLIGWGALFDRDLPWLAFMRLASYAKLDLADLTGIQAEFAFPILTPTRKLLIDPEWLHDQGGAIFNRPNRMSRANGFYEDLDRAMDVARACRDRFGLPIDAQVVA